MDRYLNSTIGALVLIFLPLDGWFTFLKVGHGKELIDIRYSAMDWPMVPKDHAMHHY